MKKFWISLSGKFEALNKRERWMVACALFAVVFAIVNSLLISPVLTRQKIMNSELATDQAQLQLLTQQINAFSNQPVIDPDADNNKRFAEIKTHLKTQEAELKDLQTTLVSPESMPDLLRSLLKKNSNLKLISLKTVPTKDLLDKDSEDKNPSAPVAKEIPQTADNKPDAPVFKHGVEITVEGHYSDLLEYVAELEKMPWHVLWSKAALNADAAASVWPANRLTLTVYTLSLDKTWLTI